MKKELIYTSLFLSSSLLIYKILTKYYYGGSGKNIDNEIKDLLDINKDKIKDAFDKEAYKNIYKNSEYKNKKVETYYKDNNIDKNKIIKYVLNLYNAKGIINDDEDLIYSTFQEMPSIFIISYISNLFENKYKISLKSYLISFLSEDELNKVYEIISNKKYI